MCVGKDVPRPLRHIIFIYMSNEISETIPPGGSDG